MDKTKTVTQFQLFSMMAISSIFCGMMYSRYTVNETSLLTYALSALISVFILLAAVIPLPVFQKKNPECNVIKAVQLKRPWLSGIFSTVYTLYFMYSSVVSLVMFSLLLSNFINTDLRFTVFFTAVLLGCYYSAYRGLTAISRASALFFIVITFLVATSCFSLVFRINPRNYSYIYLINTDGLFDNISHIVSLSSCLPSVFLFSQKVKGNMRKTLISWVVYYNIFLFVLSVVSFGVLGEYFRLTPYPFYTATQMIEVGAFQRLDAVFISLWTVGMFVNISLLLYSLRETLQSSVSANKVRYLNPLLVFLTGIIAMAAIKFDTIRHYVMDTKILFIIFLAAAFILPLAAVVSVRRKRIRSAAVKGIASLMLAVFLIPLLSGCQQTQIQDRMIVKGVGIDKVDDKYFVTVQYIDNYSDGDKQQNKCIQVVGDSIGEAIDDIRNSSGLEPFLGQNVAAVIGFETAKCDMETLLNYFTGYSDARPTVNLYISETTAEDILTLEVSGNILPIDQLTMISPSQSDNDNLFTVINFINQSMNPTDTPAVSLIYVDNNTIKLSSVLVFGKDENYKLDKNEFITYKTLLGIENGTVLSFDGISAKVTKSQTRVVSKEINGILNFDAVCSLDIVVLENPDYVSDDEIERLFNEKLGMITNECVKKSLTERQCDIYSLGRYLKFGDYRKYSDPNLYSEALKTCKSNITVKCETVETTR